MGQQTELGCRSIAETAEGKPWWRGGGGTTQSGKPAAREGRQRWLDQLNGF
jgi:hypothetical protein